MASSAGRNCWSIAGLPLLGHLNRVGPDIDQLLDGVAQLKLVCQMVKHKEGDCVKVVLKP